MDTKQEQIVKARAAKIAYDGYLKEALANSEKEVLQAFIELDVEDMLAIENIKALKIKHTAIVEINFQLERTIESGKLSEM
jgi:hypothetical protein